MQHETVLERRRFADSIGLLEQIRVSSQSLVDFVHGPDVVQTFDRIGFGVQRGVIPAARVQHVRQQEVKELFGSFAVSGVVRGTKGLSVDAGQLSVVVQHFLEMWHQPATVCAVAMKTATQMITDAARRHRVQRVIQHTFGFRVLPLADLVLQQAQYDGHGKLR